MKIGINASFARKGDSGMGQVAVNFLKSLIKIGDPQDDFFIYLEEDLDLKFPKNFHKKIIKTLYRRDDLIRKIYWEKFLLPMEVRKDGCEVFFSLYQSPTIFKKIPHLMLVHDAIVKIFPWYLNNFRKRVYYQKVDEALLKATKIMTVSNHSKLDVVRLYQRKEKDITANHIDCDPLFKKKTSAEQIEKVLNKYKLKSGKYIFYVGGFDMRKNVNSLIHAYGLLWDKYENKKDCPDLVLAGKFNPHLVPLVTDIEAEIAEVFYRFCTPKNKFKLIGFVEQADLPALYKGASVFCFPSLYEGFGLPVLEAFNCGCPVVASTNSSLKELVNKKNSFVFDLDNNDQSLADKILECLTEKDSLKKQKIMEAKKTAEQFSWEKFTRKALTELKSLNN